MTQPPTADAAGPSGRPEPGPAWHPSGEPAGAVPDDAPGWPTGPAYPAPTGGDPATGAPGRGGPAFPGHPQPTPGQPGWPAYPGAGQQQSGGKPAKRRAAVFASVALAAALLLCGGGGLAAFVLLSDAESGEGAAEPVAAVDGFLRAVYTEQDPSLAAALVCTEARDSKKIARKVAEVREYAKAYKSPRFRWDAPRIDEQNPERAVVSTRLVMTTGDEKTADQRLTFTVVKKTGWWVCEVS
jgi:hypothetical protein